MKRHIGMSVGYVNEKKKRGGARKWEKPNRIITKIKREGQRGCEGEKQVNEHLEQIDKKG